MSVDEVHDALMDLEVAALEAADACDEHSEPLGLAPRLFETWAHTAYVMRQDLTTEGTFDAPTLMEYLDGRAEYDEDGV